MNNLLSNLAARSFQSTPTLLPRLASRYEPSGAALHAVERIREPLPQQDAAESFETFEALEAGREEPRLPAARESSRRNPAAPRTAARKLEDSRNEAQGEAPQKRPAMEAQPMKRRPSLESAQEPGERVVPAERTQSPRAVLQPTATPLSVAHSDHEPQSPVTRTARATETRSNFPVLRQRAAETPDHTAVPVVTGSIEPKTPPRLPRQETRASLLPPPSLLAQNTSHDGPASIMPRREASEPRQPMQHAASAERSVHVTIGRIDIVAEMPQPSPRRAPEKAQPGISLAEYLHRRQNSGAARGSV